MAGNILLIQIDRLDHGVHNGVLQRRHGEFVSQDPDLDEVFVFGVEPLVLLVVWVEGALEGFALELVDVEALLVNPLEQEAEGGWAGVVEGVDLGLVIAEVVLERLLEEGGVAVEEFFVDYEFFLVWADEEGYD